MTACAFDACERPSVARGMCDTHYHRWWKAGRSECAGHFHRTWPDGEVNHYPPIPAGLLEAVTARLVAVRDGPDAEADASHKLLALDRQSALARPLRSTNCPRLRPGALSRLWGRRGSNTRPDHYEWPALTD